MIVQTKNIQDNKIKNANEKWQIGKRKYLPGKTTLCTTSHLYWPKIESSSSNTRLNLD